MSEPRWSVLSYLWFRLMRLFQFVLPIACARVAAQRLPWPMAALVGVVLALILSTIGALLLARSKVGEIGWRNHVAAWCLPWGAVLGRGQLPGMVLSSALVWTLIYAATLCLEVTSGMQSMLHWALLATWIAMVWCICQVLGTLMKNYEPLSRSGMNLLKIIGLMSLPLVVSIALQISGQSWYSLAVAALPIVLVGVPYGLFVLSMLTFGRNTRWN